MKLFLITVLTLFITGCNESQNSLKLNTVENEALIADYFSKGDIYFKGKKYVSALEYYSKILLIEPDNVLANILRAGTKYNLGDYNGAMKDYEQILLIDSTRITVHSQIAQCLWQLGDQKSACLKWSIAGELGDYKAYEFINKYCNKNKGTNKVDKKKTLETTLSLSGAKSILKEHLRFNCGETIKQYSKVEYI